MADVTQVATLKVFSWSRPTAPSPRLSAPISAVDTTITVTSAPLDETDAVVSVDFLMGIKNSNGYTETVFVPASGISADGLTFTTCVRGIDVSGLDYDTGNAALAMAHNQDSAVCCVVHPFNHTQWQAALQGTIGSGANNWKIGDGTDSDITVYAYNADGNKPFWRYDAATSAWVFSNDGLSSTPFGTGAGVTGSTGITVAAGAISVDLTDTDAFKATTAGAGDAGKGVLFNAAGVVDLDIIEKGADISQVCSGAGATVTAANLGTVTDGSNAEALHTHTVVNSGTTSVNVGSVPGTVNIAHGLGIAPKMVRFDAVVNATIWSLGVYDGTNNKCTGPGGAQAYSIYCDNAGAITTGTITATDATNFTISWTKVGIGVNIPYILWTALA
jgi:hypothetical protein